MRRLVCLAQLTFCAYAAIFAQSIRLAALNTGKPADQRHVPRRVDRIEFPGARDLSHLSWTEAFDALHKLLVTEYPFTNWRHIHWQRLYHSYYPRVANAQKDHNEDAFRLAIREYVYSIPDGHMHVHGAFDDLRKKAIGGGFGFAATPLVDGRVVCFRVENGSPAADAGMKPGARLLSFNDRPLKQAAAAVSILWTRKPVSTSEQRRIEQYRYLSRAPRGMPALITFVNPGETAVRKATLRAADDHFEWLNKSELPSPHNEGRSLLSHKILESGFGYIAIFGEDADMIREFKETLKEMVEQKVPAIIMDVRHNAGGDDGPAAEIASFFETAKSLYEYPQYFNLATGTFDILTSQTIYVVPRQPHFSGPVICLIGSGTTSSGEGIALEISRAPRGRTLGFHGTAGYFGMSGGSAKLPNNVEVGFPVGASLDKNQRIQLDSDYTGVGGVSPQVRIPTTYGNMLAVGRGEDVELRAAETELTRMLSSERVP